MPDQTPKLSLPLMQAAQAQKHVTHNEALELLDMLSQLTVEAFDATDPPANPGEGQSWAVGPGATGAWSGHGGDLASFRGGGWLFVVPRAGWRAWDRGAQQMRVYYSGSWQVFAGDAAATPDFFDNLTGLGVNASHDATNRLAVSSDAVLFNHAGAGHQLKLNKAGTGDTASLLYQTGFSGRAEMGLAGGDDFSIKVSSDGSLFTEALRITAATGAVEMPATPARQILPLHLRYALETDLRWCGPGADASQTLAAENLGTGAEPDVLWNAKGIFVPAGSVLSHVVLAGDIASAEVASLDLRVFFQHGPWGGWSDTPGTTRVTLHSADAAGLAGGAGMQRLGIPLSYTAPTDGYLLLALRPGAGSILTATRHVDLAGMVELACPAL